MNMQTSASSCLTNDQQIIDAPRLQHSALRTTKLWSSLAEVCALLKIDVPSSLKDHQLVFQHLRFKTGEVVHHFHDPLEYLYLVNCGFLKSVSIDADGNFLILGFPMKGDLPGVDGVHEARYQSSLVALSDCDLILLPQKQLFDLSQRSPEFAFAMLGKLSQEMARDRYMLSLQRCFSAEAKIARFLCLIGERFYELGYSSSCFNLRMSRMEMANFLGVAIETVSRFLSIFDRMGVISVKQRDIVILDADFLNQLVKLPTEERTSNSQAPRRKSSPSLSAVNVKRHETIKRKDDAISVGAY